MLIAFLNIFGYPVTFLWGYLLLNLRIVQRGIALKLTSLKLHLQSWPLALTAEALIKHNWTS